MERGDGEGVVFAAVGGVCVLGVGGVEVVSRGNPRGMVLFRGFCAEGGSESFINILSYR